MECLCIRSFSDFRGMKVILVTGGSGLVGQAVQVEAATADPTQEKWIFVSSKDANLTDPVETRALFEKHRPTHVLHLAARVGGLFLQLKEPVESCRAFQRAFSRIKRRILLTNPCSILVHLIPPTYAIAKRNLDILNQCYVREYGRCFTSVIPTNVYGPHDNFHLVDAHVIPALIHKCFLAKQAKSPFVVGGSGQPLRQFILSGDLAKLMVWTLRSYSDTSPLILAPEVEYSIAHVAKAIASAMDFQGELIFDTTQPDGQFKKTASNAKLRQLLPDFAFTPFEQGIHETVKWFLDNQATCRK
ncbi:hypothetical protein Ae201684P_014852 [Aphanomyces euteiches]|nr:hypothetical protein Ae201684P_014852 [Aphanomyces euteiches]